MRTFKQKKFFVRHVRESLIKRLIQESARCMFGIKIRVGIDAVPIFMARLLTVSKELTLTEAVSSEASVFRRLAGILVCACAYFL